MRSAALGGLALPGPPGAGFPEALCFAALTVFSPAVGWCDTDTSADIASRLAP